MDKKVKFLAPDYVQAVKDKINSDEQYARIAKNWEGDMRLVIEPDSSFSQTVWIYLDLWHGTCREAMIEEPSSTKNPAFVLKGPYGNFLKVLTGQVGPMQALMTRAVSVKGSMAVMMRNVPTVIDFVRCIQEVTEI